MYANIVTGVLQGLDGAPVDVEADLSRGLPSFNIVGLPDASIKESKERVRAAITNAGFQFPVQRITINLAPANLRKEGSQLDLAIAVAILVAHGIVIDQPPRTTAFIGELSLDGRLLPVPGALPLALSFEQMGIRHLIVPRDNLEECRMGQKIKVIAVETLEELVHYLNGEKEIPPAEPFDLKADLEENRDDEVDFLDIKGQEALKRAMEIAAAGGHNLLMIGPPGSGKTMAAMRLPTILPALSFEEALACTKIYSAAGLLGARRLIKKRPFRAPHHTASAVSLIGGGRIPKPGEISLAHHGALFLDELPEFPKSTIEVLRQPLEEKSITISRANASLTYPADFLFIAGMNPCPCGYYGDPYHECRCSHQNIQNYLNRVSRPILDRIDIHVEVAPVPIDQLQNHRAGESSETIRQRVEKARAIQQSRFANETYTTNARMKTKDIKKYIHLNAECENTLKMAFKTYHFSARSYDKLLKLARTIADLEGREEIAETHVLEAIRYRTVDQKYWE